MIVAQSANSTQGDQEMKKNLLDGWKLQSHFSIGQIGSLGGGFSTLVATPLDSESVYETIDVSKTVEY